MTLIETVNQLCMDRLGREPNLDSPSGFNDIIQWLKIYDQRKEHIAACDKWEVRKMVPKRNLIPAKIGVSVKRFPCVMKATHDCGSVQFLDSAADLEPAHKALKEHLAKPYGVEKGEWAYQFAKPRIITEDRLPESTDYKFHCSHGKVRWVQVISERSHKDGARETILDPDGAVMPLHMDQNMRHVPQDCYPGDEAWMELTRLARRLAKPWRYVRIDLYWANRNAWFGEMTFWPLAGCYMTDDEPVFGKMLEIDLSEKLEPIVT